MTKNHRSGLIGGISAVVVALAVAVPLRAAPPDREVKVVNTAADAVPIAVQGTPSVTVGNTAAHPLPMRSQDEPALQPVQRTELFLFASGQQIKDQALFTVPAGKRLVIEEASVRAQLFTGVSQAMVFLRSAGGGLAAHYVPLTAVGVVDGFGTVLVGTEMLRGYADAGTVVDASVTLNT